MAKKNRNKNSKDSKITTSKSSSNYGILLSYLVAFISIITVLYRHVIFQFIEENILDNLPFINSDAMNDHISVINQYKENIDKLGKVDTERELNFEASVFYKQEEMFKNKKFPTWSTYKPKYFFKLASYPNSGFEMGTLWQQTHSENSVVTQHDFSNTFLKNLRYKALPKGNSITYDYDLYDPIIGYGKQRIRDYENNIQLEFEYVSLNGEVGYIVQGNQITYKEHETISVINFFNQETLGNDYLRFNSISSQDTINDTVVFSGANTNIGNFTVTLKQESGKSSLGTRNKNAYPQVSQSLNNHFSFNNTRVHSFMITEVVSYAFNRVASFFLKNGNDKLVHLDMSNLQQLVDIDSMSEYDGEELERGNMHFLQSTFSSEEKFKCLIVFNNENKEITTENLEELLKKKEKLTQEKYDLVFNDMENNHNLYKELAQSTFANLYSSLQYSNGSYLYKENEKSRMLPFEVGPFELLHLSPSRNFFPRGFYWDEGFHLSTLKLYSPEMSLRIIYDWFENMMDKNTGYIPRELFIGKENMADVEEKWVTQYGDVGNPDVLIWTFVDILDEAVASNNEDTLDLFRTLLDEKKLYTYFKKRYEWLTKVQSISEPELEWCYGKIPFKHMKSHEIDKSELYQWRGQSNDHCFPSGLDDYPRAMTHNNLEEDLFKEHCEIHVDMMSWVLLFSKNLKKIALFLDRAEDAQFYENQEIIQLKNMELLNYNTKENMYCDLSVKTGTSKPEHVCHEGYVSLFPFMLRLIPENSTKRLLSILELLNKKDGILSDFGVRSLSKQDMFYKANEDYWRSKIWVNMNYLILKSLAFYFKENNSFTDTEKFEAKFIYTKIRTDLITNIYKNWNKDDLGIIFENYSDSDGQGKGVHGFTGWSSLIVNIMFELPEFI